MARKFPEDPMTQIDMTGMSQGKQKALELTESARQAKWEKPSFVGELFMGRFPAKWIYPFPEQKGDDQERGDHFLTQLETVLRESVDPDEIDAKGDIPLAAQQRLADIGAMGIKIKSEYGGLGLSQLYFVKSAVLTGSYCSNTAAYLSVHQSIGVAGPVNLFGSEELKKKYLPKVAKGAVSAFALTEKQVGSDPGRMQTVARPTEDGKAFLLNGEKLWCTNGLRAKVMVVCAKTPSEKVNGKERDQITAFVVETDTPGFSVERQCQFMGLNAIANGVIRFHDLRVPRENIIGAEGKGLKVALATLNTGRLTIAGMSLGLSKQCLHIVRMWANEREQWGATIGQHSAIAHKIAMMSASTFGMEAMLFLTSHMVDSKAFDYRLESAMCKMWITEKTWENINHCLQIRGGRGYERASSLKARGETAYPVERFLRDNRISMIFEGSSEICRLLISREALDPHLKVAGNTINSTLPWGVRLKAAMGAGLFYAGWYPKQYLPSLTTLPDVHPTLSKHLSYVQSRSKKLARVLFHNMVRFGPQLESKQIRLSRIVDIATELFMISASCSYAEFLAKQKSEQNAIALANHAAMMGREKIERLFLELENCHDDQYYQLSQEFLQNQFSFLEKGIIPLSSTLH